ncbi:V-type proton ATPase subunit Vha13 isoform X1 [Amblyomma americanum]
MLRIKVWVVVSCDVKLIFFFLQRTFQWNVHFLVIFLCRNLGCRFVPETCKAFSSASECKAKRLKQAKDEAEVEIGKFKAEKERQFKEYEARHMGSKEDIAAKIEAETRQKMNEMNQLVAQHKKAVIEKLLSLVYDIDPQVHRNFRPAQ